jgi:large subunit ribosomal protein L30e
MSKDKISEGMQKEKRRKRTSKKEEFDINKLVNIAIKTGKSVIGTDNLKKQLFSGDVKLVILASNCPEDIKNSINSLIKSKGIESYTYPYTSWDLGAAAGKPFMVASLGIIEPGDSTILDAIKKEEASA